MSNATSPDQPVDGSAPTLGDIAEILRPLKAHGVTRSAMEYVIDQVWFDEPSERA